MKTLASVAAITLIFGLGSPKTSVGQVLSIGSETISPNGIATVALDISGLGNGTALGTYDVNIGFASNVLSFGSATYGDPIQGDQLDLEGFGTLSQTTPGTGSVELFELSLDSSSVLKSTQATKFTLATLTFNALGVGSSPLILSINSLGDPDGNTLTANLQNGIVTVSAVPEPDLAWLIAIGLVVLSVVTKGKIVAARQPAIFTNGELV